MKNHARSRKLLKDLSRDPRLRKVISKARRTPAKEVGSKVESATGMFMLLSAILSRFSKKKRARAIDDFADTVQLLVRVSLLLKENVFDRPEVKRFFRQRSRQVYGLLEGWLSTILPARELTVVPARRTRPART